MEHGAQRSASGRGNVDAYAGDLITTNPGEVHDGRPLGGPSRRWRIVYLEPGVVASMREQESAADIEIKHPVIQDAMLRVALQQLFHRLDDGGDVLACEESLVRVCARLLDRHATTWPERKADGDVRQARDRLADDLLHPPTLDELARTAGLIGKGASLADAAASSGFADQSHMTRIFVRQFGFTPGAWRNAVPQ